MTDSQYFTRTVTELGEARPVLASRAIFNVQGTKIIDKGARINLGLYERLMQHQLSEPLEDSVTSAPAVTGAVLRSGAEEILDSSPFFTRMAGEPKARSTLLDAVAKVPLPDPMAFQLTLAREVRPALYQQALCAALTAAWLAQVPLGSRFDLSMAAAAGLLHDIGMLHVDPSLLQPGGHLSREQRRQLYSHPLVSQALMERHHEYPKEVVRAVLEHHEYLDGSGYPRNLAGAALSGLGRILSLTEVITAMFAPGRRAPELRLSVILRMNWHRYDETLVLKVMQLIKPECDAQGGGVVLLPDPVGRLREIDRLITGWPADLQRSAGLGANRREGLERLAGQVAQLCRTLATVGVTPDQLAHLGSEPLDSLLQQELTLIAAEAAWQLRALARQTRRRWRLVQDEQYPEALLQWLEQVDALVAGGDQPVDEATAAP